MYAEGMKKAERSFRLSLHYALGGSQTSFYLLTTLAALG
jgi:hypothetical protein